MWHGQSNFGLFAAALQQAWLGDNRFAIRRFHRYLGPGLGDERLRKKGAHRNQSRRQFRRDSGACDIIGGAPFQTNRLPDPRKRPVPALFAERNFGKRRFGKLVRIVHRAVSPDLDLVDALNELFGDVERERQEAADMQTDEFAVNPGPGYVEHSAEFQEYAVALPARRDLDLPSINPGSGAHSQIGELRLPGSGNPDAPPAYWSRTIILDQVKKIPNAVERYPMSGTRLSAACGCASLRANHRLRKHSLIRHSLDTPTKHRTTPEMITGV